MKTTTGNATDAQLAADMVSRCRTAILAKPDTDQWFALPRCFRPTLANTWADAVAADTASSSFAFHGVFANAVMVRRTSDNVVYKVSIDGTAPPNDRFTIEKNTFDTLNTQGRTWLCDYWPWDTPKVIAMKQYTFLQPIGAATALRLGGEPDHAQTITAEYGTTAELQGMVASGVEFSAHTLGLDTNGKLVLLDGSLGF